MITENILNELLDGDYTIEIKKWSDGVLIQTTLYLGDVLVAESVNPSLEDSLLDCISLIAD